MDNFALNIKILESASDEIRIFETEHFDLNTYMPYWERLIAAAKLEFMNRVFQELPHIVFTNKECNAILEHENFLDLCWRTWIDEENSIYGTIEMVVEYLVD